MSALPRHIRATNSKRLTATALAVVSFAVTACGSSSEQTATTEDTVVRAAEAAPVEAPEDSKVAASTSPATATGLLDVTGTDLDGNIVNLADYAGKDLILFFWAPWCPFCQREAPQVSEVAAELEGDPTFSIVGIGGRDTEDPMREFVEKYSLNSMVNVADVDGEIWDRFGITGQPAFVLIDDDGRSQTIFGGVSDLRSVVDQLREL